MKLTRMITTTDKVAVTKQLLSLDNLTQLKAFLGLINFYSILLPKLDMVQEPLHGLLRRETA